MATVLQLHFAPPRSQCWQILQHGSCSEASEKLVFCYLQTVNSFLAISLGPCCLLCGGSPALIAKCETVILHLKLCLSHSKRGRYCTVNTHSTLQNKERELSVLSGTDQKIQSMRNRITVETREARAALDFSSDFACTCNQSCNSAAFLCAKKGFTDTEQPSSLYLHNKVCIFKKKLMGVLEAVQLCYLGTLHRPAYTDQQAEHSNRLTRPCCRYLTSTGSSVPSMYLTCFSHKVWRGMELKPKHSQI